MSTLCIECRSHQGRVNNRRNDYGHAKGVLVRTPSQWAADKVRELREDLREAEELLAAHQADCEIAKARVPASRWPSGPLGIPTPVKKKRGRRRVVIIDREAMTATLAELDQQAEQPAAVPARGSNHLPSTGRCHECDRPVSGERRFCGPCLARRSA